MTTPPDGPPTPPASSPSTPPDAPQTPPGAAPRAPDGLTAAQRYARSPKGQSARRRASARWRLRQSAKAGLTYNEALLKEQREGVGLPYPVPEHEFRDQEIARRAQERADGIPTPYTLDDIT